MKARRSLLRLGALAVGVVIVCAIEGCSFIYTFEISGVIRDVEQGAPLADVDIAFVDRWGNEPVKGTIVTRADGKFAFTYEAINAEADGPWNLKLSKQSYEPEEVEISIDATVLSPKVPTYVHVVAYLRPEKGSDAAVAETTR